jgi:hypothetical protein
VVAFTRQGATTRPAQEGVQWRDLNVFDVEAVTSQSTYLQDVSVNTRVIEVNIGDRT